MKAQFTGADCSPLEVQDDKSKKQKKKRITKGESEEIGCNRRREHEYALGRNKNFTVILRRFFGSFDPDEFLVLAYLLSLAPHDHPAETRMALDLGFGKAHIHAALEKLRKKSVIFSDFTMSGRTRKDFWHISHPCHWEGSAITPAPKTVDPRSHMPSALTTSPTRINEARPYIMEQSDSMRLPNLLFRVGVSALSRRVYAFICSLPFDDHPTVKEIALKLGVVWRTADNALKELDAAGMIVIETLESRFGESKRQHFHTTDCHFWKFAEAQAVYKVPPRPSILMSMERNQAKRRPTDAGMPPTSPSVMTAEQSAVMDHTTAFEIHRTAFQTHRIAFPRIAYLPYSTTLQPQSRRDMGRCNQPSEESQKESQKEGHEFSPVSLRQLLPRKRVLSISSSADHVWVSTGNRTFDHDLWPDLIQDMANRSGEAHVRKFARYVIQVFTAGGSNALPYNSAVMDDIAEAFEAGISPAEFISCDSGQKSCEKDQGAGAPGSVEHQYMARDREEGANAPEAALEYENLAPLTVSDNAMLPAPAAEQEVGDDAMLVDWPETRHFEDPNDEDHAFGFEETGPAVAVEQRDPECQPAPQPADALSEPRKMEGASDGMDNPPGDLQKPAALPDATPIPVAERNPVNSGQPRPPSRSKINKVKEVLSGTAGKKSAVFDLWQMSDQQLMAHLRQKFTDARVDEVLRAIA